jgi:integrase/recombinase XerD
MTELRAAAEEYLTIRRAVGFKLNQVGYLLEDFVGFLETVGATRITTELAVAWATGPKNATPAWWGQRLSAVRGFARHLHLLDPTSEVPPTGVLPQRFGRATPYLYSRPDIAGLMTAARRLTPSLRATTYETLIGLLFVTGMRVGEAIGLNVDDVDVTHGLVRIVHAKFNKARELPVAPSTADALGSYLVLRDELQPWPKEPSFFVSTVGTRLYYRNVCAVFRRLVDDSGLESRSPCCPPRLHALRHSFAVRTLLGWYRAGGDVQARLPLLSTYLGHAGPDSTYWYLSAAPELLALAAERLESAHRRTR